MNVGLMTGDADVSGMGGVIIPYARSACSATATDRLEAATMAMSRDEAGLG